MIQEERKCSYLSSAIDIIRVSLIALQQGHVGEVLHWVRKSQEDLALLWSKKTISQTCSMTATPSSIFLVAIPNILQNFQPTYSLLLA